MTTLGTPAAAAFAPLPARFLDPEVLKVIPATALHLWSYLWLVSDFRTGALPKDAVYQHAEGAVRLGVSERTATRWYVQLERAGFLRTRRTLHGVRFRLLRVPLPQQTNLSAENRGAAPGEQTNLSAELPEPPDLAACESKAAKSVCLDRQICLLSPPGTPSDSCTEGEGEQTPTVEEAAPLAPPAVKSPLKHPPPVEEALVAAERLYRSRFPDEVRIALASAMQAPGIDPAGWGPALRQAIHEVTRHPEWKPEVPGTWAGQFKKAARRRAITGAPPPQPASAPPWVTGPPPDPGRYQSPEESRPAREAARALLKPTQLRPYEPQRPGPPGASKPAGAATAVPVGGFAAVGQILQEGRWGPGGRPEPPDPSPAPQG
jgi:hypothetical protein